MTREEAIDVLKHNYPSSCFTDLCEAVEIAVQALSIQPERKGKWKQISPAKIYECSMCGGEVMTSDIFAYRFCHHCGARMEEEE